jgi:hypothetical protein
VGNIYSMVHSYEPDMLFIVLEWCLRVSVADEALKFTMNAIM